VAKVILGEEPDAVEPIRQHADLGRLCPVPLTFTKQIKVLIVSWNMGREPQAPHLPDLIPNHMEYNVVIVAVQECPRNQKEKFM
jgi:hypothetical protein